MMVTLVYSRLPTTLVKRAAAWSIPRSTASRVWAAGEGLLTGRSCTGAAWVAAARATGKTRKTRKSRSLAALGMTLPRWEGQRSHSRSIRLKGGLFPHPDCIADHLAARVLGRFNADNGNGLSRMDFEDPLSAPLDRFGRLGVDERRATRV